MAIGASLAAQPKLALLGSFSPGKSLETEAVQKAVDAADAMGNGPQLKLEVFNTGVGDASLDQATRRVVDDPGVLAVVVYGEEGAGPGPLAAFEKAGLAVVEATSWSQPRPSTPYATWLSPDMGALAGTAALYARREARMLQIAVVDDGSPTSVAGARAFTQRYRALGGKIPFIGTWTGDAAGLSATVRAMAPFWPQMVFFTGEAVNAGRLVLAMKGERSLRNADLFGLPPLFDTAFFDVTRLKGMRTRAIFPCPDYDGMGALVRDLGFAFPRTSPQYRAYLHFDFRHPGRWTAMLYDGAALAARAVRLASAPSASASLSPSAQLSESPSAATDAVRVPGRDAVRLALLSIGSYRGMRGDVKFNALREPSDARAMIYFALKHVDQKEMMWRQRAYGPPF